NSFRRTPSPGGAAHSLWLAPAPLARAQPRPPRGGGALPRAPARPPAVQPLLADGPLPGAGRTWELHEALRPTRPRYGRGQHRHLGRGDRDGHHRDLPRARALPQPALPRPTARALGAHRAVGG